MVVPQLEHGHRLDDRRQQEPAHDRFVAIGCLGHDRLEREPQGRHARAGSLRAPARQAVENEVDRSRRRRRDGGSSGRLGNLLDTGVGIDASGVHGRSERLEICLACQCRIECFEPSGGVEKERRTVAAAREDERDLRAQSLQQPALKLVQRSELGGREQRLGGLAASRLELGLRGGERARPASCRVRGQLGRSLQERGRGRDAAAAAGAVGRAFQLIGDRLVEPGCSVRAMPCAAIRILRGIRRFGQGAMHRLAFGHVCRPVHGRAHQRVAEAHAGTERDQLRRLGRRNRFGPDSESLGRAPQQRDVAHWLGRRCKDQLLGLGQQHFESPQEALLDVAGQRPCLRDAESARQLGGRQAAGQLHQRERIAARLGDDPVPDPLVEHPRQRGSENGARVAFCEPLDDELGETCEFIRLAGLANGEHHRDPLGEQASRHECQRLRGRAVEPLRVVDEAHQGTRLGRVGKQTQRRKGDQEVVRGSAVLHAERNPQRISLRVGDPVEAVEYRARTAGADQRREAPSRTAPLRLARHDTLPPPRRRSAATPSSRPLLRRAAPRPGSGRPARRPAGGPLPRTQRAGPASTICGAGGLPRSG